MSTRRLIVLLAAGIAAIVLVTSAISYALWSGGDEPPTVVTTQ